MPKKQTAWDKERKKQIKELARIKKIKGRHIPHNP
jgi:hypothetical protein